MKGAWGLIGAIFGLAGFSSGWGQTIDSPFDIRLVPVELDGGGYKYGIYASMAGSTNPQLYELDTGGTGFYAVFGTNAPYVTPAWGSDYTLNSTNVTMGYASGNVYTGNSVTTSVTIYSANSSGGYDSGASLTSGNVLIGQTLEITNTEGKTTSGDWPSPTPPVDQHFYGDFGLALSFAPNGIMNVLSQFNYGPNVIPGFVVNLGTPGNPDAKIQVGIDGHFEELYPIRIRIQGQDTNNPFPLANGATNALPTYSEAVLSAAMGLTNSTAGAFTNEPTQVILDTGASGTLYLDGLAPTSLTNYFALTPEGEQIADGTQLSLVVETTDGAFIDLFSGIAGTDGFNLNVTTRSNFSLNLGQYLFYQYEVAYNLQDGVLGLRPLAVPEPRQAWFSLLAVLALIGFAAIRSATDKRR